MSTEYHQTFFLNPPWSQLTALSYPASRPKHFLHHLSPNLLPLKFVNSSGVSGCYGEEMGLTGKIVRQVEIKSDGDVFHEIYRDRPHHVANMSPGKVHGCDLHEGEFGTVGSVISWNYTHEGKKKKTKEIIEAIDQEKKLVIFKCIEGDQMELYKTLVITLSVDTKGESNLVTWTLEYEKLNEGVEDPNTIADLLKDITKDIEAHHLE